MKFSRLLAIGILSCFSITAMADYFDLKASPLMPFPSQVGENQTVYADYIITNISQNNAKQNLYVVPQLLPAGEKIVPIASSDLLPGEPAPCSMYEKDKNVQLANGASCTYRLSFTSGAAPSEIPVAGSNKYLLNVIPPNVISVATPDLTFDTFNVIAGSTHTTLSATPASLFLHPNQAQTITIKNTGAYTANFVHLNIQQPYLSHLVAAGTKTQCGNIAPGATCTLSIEVDSEGLDPSNALLMASNATTTNIPLSNGYPATLAVNPAAVTLKPNATSENIVVSNSGDEAATNVSLVIPSAYASYIDTAHSVTTCASIAAKSSCSMKLVTTALPAGLVNTATSITASNAKAIAFTFADFYQGVLSVSPTTVVAKPGALIDNILVSNAGPGTVNNVSLTVPTAYASYVDTAHSVTTCASLAAKASCKMSLTFLKTLPAGLAAATADITASNAETTSLGMTDFYQGVLSVSPTTVAAKPGALIDNIMVSNAGPGTVNNVSLTVPTAYASYVDTAHSVTTCASIAAKASCKMSLTFLKTLPAGLADATADITASNAVTTSLSMTDFYQGVLSVSPASVAAKPGALIDNIMVSNAGPGTVNNVSLTVPTAYASYVDTAHSVTTCASIAAKASCKMSLTFLKTLPAGLAAATANITASNAVTTSLAMTDFYQGVMSVDPTSVVLRPGVDTDNIVVTNAGPNAITNIKLTLPTEYASYEDTANSVTTCASIAAKASCTMHIKMLDTLPATLNADTAVISSTNAASIDLGVSTDYAGVLTATPASLLLLPKVDTSVVLHNSGPGAVSNVSLVLPADYAKYVDTANSVTTCASIPANGSCTVQLKMLDTMPVTLGSEQAVVTSKVAKSINVEVHTGYPNTLSVNPVSVLLLPGEKSISIDVTNSGASTIPANAITLTLPKQYAPYVDTAHSVLSCASVASGSDCDLTIAMLKTMPKTLTKDSATISSLFAPAISLGVYTGNEVATVSTLTFDQPNDVESAIVTNTGNVALTSVKANALSSSIVDVTPTTADTPCADITASNPLAVGANCKISFEAAETAYGSSALVVNYNADTFPVLTTQSLVQIPEPTVVINPSSVTPPQPQTIMGDTTEMHGTFNVVNTSKFDWLNASVTQSASDKTWLTLTNGTTPCTGNVKGGATCSVNYSMQTPINFSSIITANGTSITSTPVSFQPTNAFTMGPETDAKYLHMKYAAILVSNLTQYNVTLTQLAGNISSSSPLYGKIINCDQAGANCDPQVIDQTDMPLCQPQTTANTPFVLKANGGQCHIWYRVVDNSDTSVQATVPVTVQGTYDDSASTVKTLTKDFNIGFQYTLYASGNFYDQPNKAYETYVSRFNGSRWNTVPALTGEPGRVQTMATYKGDLLVGGSFDELNKVSGTSGIARWDGTHIHPLATGLTENLSINGVQLKLNVNAIYDHQYTDPVSFQQKDTLYVGGQFNSADNITNLHNIASFDGTTWHALGKGVDAGSTVNALAWYQNQLAVAGNFLTAGNGQYVYSLALWQPTPSEGPSWRALGFKPNTSTTTYNQFRTLAVRDDTLYVGGNFKYKTLGTNVIKTGFVISYDGSEWKPLNDTTNGFAGSPVESLFLDDDSNLWIGNDTSFIINNESFGPVLKYGSHGAWSKLGEGSEVLGPVHSVIKVGKNVYIGQNPSGTSSHGFEYAMQWDGNKWSDLASATLPGPVIKLLSLPVINITD